MELFTCAGADPTLRTATRPSRFRIRGRRNLSHRTADTSPEMPGSTIGTGRMTLSTPALTTRLGGSTRMSGRGGIGAGSCPPSSRPTLPRRGRTGNVRSSASVPLGGLVKQYDFGKLREDAWVGFLEGSQQFHDAQFERSAGTGERFARAFQRLVELMLRVFGVIGRSADWSGAETVEMVAAESRSRRAGRPKPHPVLG
jgi:hypothetical protein